MSNLFDRRAFMKTVGVGAVSTIAPVWAYEDRVFEGMDLFPTLNDVGDKFSFAIFSDPQVGPMESDSRVYMNSRRTQIQAVREVNEMNPMPVFSMFLGDLVNVPNKTSFDNFVDCTKATKMQQIWNHGNHDTRPPYDLFKKYQKEQCGHEEVFYSWDVGKWHMISLPCNFDWQRPQDVAVEKAMLKWLETDIDTNKDKPTMVFSHLHLVPLGLSQLEWYTHRLELRQKFMELLTRHGNVKWYFNGHVHNGIQTSLKMSKAYKGINFITCPTIIESRPFGEEFVEYHHGGATGGYYMMVEVNGEDVQLKGRLVNVSKEYKFPGTFPVLKEDQEPRWFKRVVDFEPVDEIINGNFEKGLKGWYKPLRYTADEDPAYETAVSSRFKRSGTQSAFVKVMAKGREFWANDENNHLYQVVKAPSADRHIFKASYFLQQRPENAGGYIRFNAISDNNFKFMMMCKWGDNEDRATFLPRCFGYEVYGKQQSWAYLSELGRQRKGFYWNILDDPKRWHDLTIDIGDMFDRCFGQMGAFEKLGITKYHVSVGTWTNREAGSCSEAHFDNISLTGEKEKVDSKNDDRLLGVNSLVFITYFGQQLKDDVERGSKRDKGKQIINPPKGEIKL